MKEATSAGDRDAERRDSPGSSSTRVVTDEPLHRLDDGGDRVVQVQLDDVGAGPFAGVADGEGEGELAVRTRLRRVHREVAPAKLVYVRPWPKAERRESGRCWTPR
ncbi:hypothetical protein GCM10023238_33080 [Streptomyces heliomycini]